VERARQLILDVIGSVKGVLDEPAPELLTEGFGDATLNMAARFWVNQETHNLQGVHSQVIDAVNDLAEREDIDMPYPTQVVQLETELPFETPVD
jgi:small conductance mechanosensitive channel